MSTPQFVTDSGPPSEFPLTFEVEYPDRPLNRLTTFFRLFCAIPILVVIGSIEREYSFSSHNGSTTAGGSLGILVLGPLLMIVFREKYPRWWFDFNLQMLRFATRVGLYIALLNDQYPSTDEQQSLTLDVPYPDAEQELNRFLPLVKWLLLLPHYVVLLFLGIGVFFTVIFAWFAILFTGRYPRGAFDYVVGVQRWWMRVVAYGFLLSTDHYPPFSLRP